MVLLGISLTVLVSARVQTFQGAYQSSSALVLLVVALFAGQLSGVLYLSVGIGMLIGCVFWIGAGVLICLAIKSFNRESLLIGRN